MAAEAPCWSDMSGADQEAVFAWFTEKVKDAPFAKRVMLVANSVTCVMPGMPAFADDAGASGAAAEQPFGEALVQESTFLVLQGMVLQSEIAARDELIAGLEARVGDVEAEVDVVLEPGSAMAARECGVTVLNADGRGSVVPLGDVAGIGSAEVALLTFGSAISPEALGNVHGLAKFVGEKRAEWAGRVRVVAVWVDEEFPISDLGEQISSNGWDVEGLAHVWSGAGGEESELATALSLTSLPVTILVNADGCVVWQGMSGSLDFESEVDALLDGTSELLATWKREFSGASILANALGRPSGACGCSGDACGCAAAEGAACGSGGCGCAGAPKRPSWVVSAPTAEERAAKMAAVVALGANSAFVFDSFMSQAVTLVSADGCEVDAKLSVSGEFARSSLDALQAVFEAMEEAAGAALDTGGVEVYDVAEPLAPSAVCGACGKAAYTAGSDEPAFVCIHCPDDLTHCASCFWTVAHPADHTFIATLGDRTNTAGLRHGRGTVEQANPAESDEVVDGMHVTVQCDGCAINPLALVRYKCAHCADYDLCAECHGLWAASPEGRLGEDDGYVFSHGIDHAFLALRTDQ